jgi:hypothetical protein
VHDVTSEPEAGLDLHLEWVNGPPEHKPSASLERPIVETPFSGELFKSDRMRLVLALGQSEVELRCASNAIDTRQTGDPTGAMEEVREYLAAAFDAVRELTGQLVTLTDRLELAPGRPPSEEVAFSLPSPPPPDPPPAPPVDSHAVDRIERALIRIATGQEDLLKELERLGDEVEAYRRRVQIHARPPVISDAQVDEIVERISGRPTVPPPSSRKKRVAVVAPEEPVAVVAPAEPGEKVPWRERRRRAAQTEEGSAGDE